MSFSTVRIEGGLLSAELLEQAALGEARGQRPEDFGLERSRRLTDEIAAAWSDARVFWDALQHSLRRVPDGDPATTPTREQWVIPLLRSLGYPQVSPMRSAALVDGQTYFVSHRAGESDEAPPVQIIGIHAKLDERPPSGRPRLSPHSLVQEYLNRTDHLWGIVTNGARLRLLRDSSRITRPAYVEFDLEAMLTGEKFAEFGLLYRLIHRTRLPQVADDAPQCLLEGYYQEAMEQGGRVREKLRDGVEEALKLFGNGFLAHPANEKLRARVSSGDLEAEDYRQLLRLIYRLLFLMVAEERGLIAPGAASSPNGRTPASLYQRHYSIARLRGLAEQSVGGTSRHTDLWMGLLTTFHLFEEEGAGSPLGVAALDGDLFGPQALPDLEDTRLPNGVLLSAMRCLSLYEERAIRRRVNYAALDVEELGSVSESLLDFRPVVREDGSTAPPCFDLVTGSDRKTTGSYYTRPELVQELIKSALEPVMEDRLKTASTPAEKERRLLALKVCDPACGSGHFLLAAARRIGRELARLRSGEAEPTPTDFRHGVRDAIRHCLYGVDVNPLAVDLCKVALWMEAHIAGEPLTFLDHRIRLGNSLIGAFPMPVGSDARREQDLPQGIPDEAFNPVTGDDRRAATAIKRRNRTRRDGQPALFDADLEPRIQEPLARRNWNDYARRLRELGELPDGTVEKVRRKQRLMEELRQTPEYEARKLALDLWAAAFFWPLCDANQWVPGENVYREWLEDALPISEAARTEIVRLAVANRFFHWGLEFPDVFNEQDGGSSGFDVVLGNPPWERIKIQEEEHWIDEPYIVGAPNKSERARRIAEYRTCADLAKRARVSRFDAAKHAAEAWSKFVRESQRWPLTAVGDVNTYALFAELARNLLSRTGRVGIIVPTGIATDDTTKAFFGDLVTKHSLVSLIGFENESFIFPAIHHSFKFCTMTIAGSARETPNAEFAFLCRSLDDAYSPARRFELSWRDLVLLNPNTMNCPVFRTSADAELAKALRHRVPVLVNDREGENPWCVSFMRMLDMANDSGVFLTDPGEDCVPLYEAKMIWHFDHRFGSYEGRADERGFRVLPETTLSSYQDAEYRVKPYYWVPRREVIQRLEGRWERAWLLAFRDVTAAHLERTSVFSIVPLTGVGHTAPLVLFPIRSDARHIACFLANANSLVFDYLARQKLGGNHLTYTILKQLPMLRPNDYSTDDLAFVVPRVLELVYTAWDVQPFALDLGYDGPTFLWDEERRAHLRAQLDAFYFDKYGLTRKQVRFVLEPHLLTDQELATIMEEHEDPADAPKTRAFPGETFRVLKQNEQRKYGEYRTQRLVLFYDQAIRDGEWSQFEMGLPRLGEGPKPKIGKDREREIQERDTWRTGTDG